MFVRQDAVEQIAEQVAELVEARWHVEPFYVWTGGRNRKLMAYPTDQPSLLDQLRTLVDEPLIEEVEGGRAVPGSRSPAGDDALDRLMAIEAGTAWWASVRLRRDLRETVEDNLRLLVGMATRLEDVDLRDLEVDIRRFHAWAATLTGWQTPPWRPRAPCPLCDRIGTLRVHLDKKRGLCTGCGETWSQEDGTIVFLADHIRGLGEDQQERAGART